LPHEILTVITDLASFKHILFFTLVLPYPPPAKANGSSRSTATIEIVTIKLLAWVTL